MIDALYRWENGSPLLAYVTLEQLYNLLFSSIRTLEIKKLQDTFLHTVEGFFRDDVECTSLMQKLLLSYRRGSAESLRASNFIRKWLKWKHKYGSRAVSSHRYDDLRKVANHLLCSHVSSSTSQSEDSSEDSTSWNSNSHSNSPKPSERIAKPMSLVSVSSISVYDYHPTEVASHLSMYVSQLFITSDIDDYYRKKWKGSSYIAHMNAYSNLIMCWVVNKIFFSVPHVERAITFFIAVATECLSIGNYDTAFNIYGAFNTCVVSKVLEDIWCELDISTKERFNNIKEAFNPGMNYHNYRKSLLANSDRIIPILPLILSDLTQIEEKGLSLSSDRLVRWISKGRELYHYNGKRIQKLSMSNSDQPIRYYNWQVLEDLSKIIRLVIRAKSSNYKLQNPNQQLMGLLFHIKEDCIELDVRRMERDASNNYVIYQRIRQLELRVEYIAKQLEKIMQRLFPSREE